jgi:multisubunit Na+/H+ antiporter MnhB subunit
MMYLVFILFIITVYEFVITDKKYPKKDIAIYIFFCVITLSLGYTYLSNPFKYSIAYILLKTLNNIF